MSRPISANGELTAQQIADGYPDETAALQALQRDGFVHGVIVQWQDANGTEVSVELYQFSSADGAHANASFQDDFYRRQDIFIDQSTLLSVPGGRLYALRSPNPQSGMYFDSAIAARGTFAVWLRVRAARPIEPSAVSPLIASQYDLLPS